MSFWLIFWAGLILLVSIFTWAYFNIRYQRKAIEHIVEDADRAFVNLLTNARDAIEQKGRTLRVLFIRLRGEKDILGNEFKGA